MENTGYMTERMQTSLQINYLYHSSSSSTHSSSTDSPSTQPSSRRSVKRGPEGQDEQNASFHRPVTRSSKLTKYMPAREAFMLQNTLRELITPFFDVKDMKRVGLVNHNWRKTICVNKRQYLWCDTPASLIVLAYVKRHLHNTKENPMTFFRLEGRQFMKVEQYFSFKINCCRFSEIHYFDTLHEYIDDTALANLACLTKLQSLHINVHVTDAALHTLSHCTWLKKLSIKFSSEITDTGMNAISNLTGLQSLSINCIQVTDVGLNALKGLVKLEKLSIGWSAITDEGLSALTGLTLLRRLSFQYVDLTAVTLTQLASLKLERLKFFLCFPKNVDALRNSSTLKSLCVGGVQEMTDSKVGQLFQLTMLQKLSLYNCGTTMDGGLPLSPLRQFSNLQTLIFNNTWIREDELFELAHLTALETLAIRECGISGAKVNELKQRIAPRRLRILR